MFCFFVGPWVRGQAPGLEAESGTKNYPEGTPSFLISIGRALPPSTAPHRPLSRAATARRRRSDPRRGATTRQG
eukprot:4425320-Pyramimonas_sp.AAC.1